MEENKVTTVTEDFDRLEECVYCGMEMPAKYLNDHERYCEYQDDDYEEYKTKKTQKWNQEY
jgi:hypothetical protein